ncbi:MAG: hypothetical protein BWY70_00366 [Bacteroidetes bacterium ADurb.Bin408]|nr:MAG: hypothetical protein BWY70_00366 [Bacteroidetes bacterium ADurb.Bin408]
MTKKQQNYHRLFTDIIVFIGVHYTTSLNTQI